jgi:hypothetical protein
MGDTPRRRMRSVSVAIGVTAVAAAALSGCTSTQDYDAVCIDEDTQERVSDYNCDDYSPSSGGSTYVWYYVDSSRRTPSLGSRVSGGSTVKPADYEQGNGRSSGSGSSYDSGNSSTDYGGFGGSSGGVSS